MAGRQERESGALLGSLLASSTPAPLCPHPRKEVIIIPSRGGQLAPETPGPFHRPPSSLVGAGAVCFQPPR